MHGWRLVPVAVAALAAAVAMTATTMGGEHGDELAAEDVVVLSGIDARFDQFWFSACARPPKMAARCGSPLHSAACRGINLSKLLRAMEYLLAHDAPILTANYLLRPREVWVRRGELFLSTTEICSRPGESREGCPAHRAMVTQAAKQLEARQQATKA